MKKTMIKFIAGIVLLTALAGCTYDSVNVLTVTAVEKLQTSFNDEHYVWENFIFTTNVVKEVK